MDPQIDDSDSRSLTKILQSLSARLRKIASITMRTAILRTGLVLIGVLVVFLIFRNFGSPYSQNPTVDEEHEQSQAVIKISAPQVFSREALINDRRDELRYLGELLEKTEVGKIESDFVRKLRKKNEISAFLGVSNKNSQMPKDSNIGIERAVENYSQKEGKTSTLEALQNDSQLNRRNEGNDLREKSKDDKQLKLSLDDFRQRQALRSELRAAISEVNLDDLHDYGGNALYRLQFRVTVMPGEHKGQYGRAKLTIKGPKLEKEDIANLYFAWLAHLTQDISGEVRAQSFFAHGEHAFSKSSGLFDIAPSIKFSGKDPSLDLLKKCLEMDGQLKEGLREKGCDRRDYAVPRLAGPIFKDLPTLMDGFLKEVNELRVKSKKTKKEEHDSQTTSICKKAHLWLKKNEKKYKLSRHKLSPIQVILTLAPILSSGNKDSPQNAGYGSYGAIEASYKVVLDFVAKYKKICNPEDLKPYESLENLDVFVPDIFKKKIKQETTENIVGKAFAYAQTPLQLTQRVSTLAQAVESLRLELGEETLPWLNNESSGVTKFLTDQSGEIQNTERFPLVVGFSDSSKGMPHFGWVFGPKVVNNHIVGEVRLEHSLAVYNVSADVSVPGWWPSLRLSVETTWVENWHADNIIHDTQDSSDEDKLYNVVFPLSSASLDNLTDFLAASTIGTWMYNPQTPSISNVIPSLISGCQDEVTFLIYGDKLWKQSEVYLGGFPADRVNVLPQMSGIAAKFKLSQVLSNKVIADNSSDFEMVMLTIPSNYPRSVGTRIWPIKVFYPGVSRGGKAKCTKRAFHHYEPVLPPKSEGGNPPSISKITPKEFPRCSLNGLSIFVEGEGLSKATEILLAGVRGKWQVVKPLPLSKKEKEEEKLASELIGIPALPKTNKVFMATFPNASFLKNAPDVIQLSVGNPHGLDTTTVAVVPCVK